MRFPFCMRITARQRKPKMTDKIYRLPEVLDVTGLCRSGVYKALAAKDFPEPLKIGKRAVGWLETELMDWVATRQRRKSAK
jgi:prophage regulatory protein